jgi:hypothetical protein
MTEAKAVVPESDFRSVQLASSLEISTLSSTFVSAVPSLNLVRWALDVLTPVVNLCGTIIGFSVGDGRTQTRLPPHTSRYPPRRAISTSETSIRNPDFDLEILPAGMNEATVARSYAQLSR